MFMTRQIKNKIQVNKYLGTTKSMHINNLMKEKKNQQQHLIENHHTY